MTGNPSSGTSTTSAAATFTSLCPAHSFQTHPVGTSTYEIECGYQLFGTDIGLPYNDYNASSFFRCVQACNYWNANNASSPSSTPCVGAVFQLSNSACLNKGSISSPPNAVNADYQGARLIYSAYESITDAPSTVSSTSPTVTSGMATTSSNMAGSTSSTVIATPSTSSSGTSTVTVSVSGTSFLLFASFTIPQTFPKPRLASFIDFDRSQKPGEFSYYEIRCFYSIAIVSLEVPRRSDSSQARGSFCVERL